METWAETVKGRLRAGRKQTVEWNRLVAKLINKKYTIYKNGQEIINSLLCHEEFLSKEDKIMIERLYISYNITSSIVDIIADTNRIFIVQTSNGKK